MPSLTLISPALRCLIIILWWIKVLKLLTIELSGRFKVLQHILNLLSLLPIVLRRHFRFITSTYTVLLLLLLLKEVHKLHILILLRGLFRLILITNSFNFLYSSRSAQKITEAISCLITSSNPSRWLLQQISLVVSCALWMLSFDSVLSRSITVFGTLWSSDSENLSRTSLIVTIAPCLSLWNHIIES